MKKILEEVCGAASIAISGHIRPDGDCVGSCMGLYLYLTKEFPDTQIDIFLEKPSEVFNCIQGVEQIKDAAQYQQSVYDVFIALDCSKDRLGEAEVILATTDVGMLIIFGQMPVRPVNWFMNYLKMINWIWRLQKRYISV